MIIWLVDHSPLMPGVIVCHSDFFIAYSYDRRLLSFLRFTLLRQPQNPKITTDLSKNSIFTEIAWPWPRHEHWQHKVDIGLQGGGSRPQMYLFFVLFKLTSLNQRHAFLRRVGLSLHEFQPRLLLRKLSQTCQYIGYWARNVEENR